MHRLSILLLILLASGLACTATAQDYDAGLAAFDAGDYASAAQEWAAVAASGDARARSNLRLMAEGGLSLPIPADQALAFYRQGAARGVTLSQINLALALLHGRGTQADPDAALMWLTQAACSGDAEAQVLLRQLADRFPAPDRQAARTWEKDGLGLGPQPCLAP